MDVYTRNYYSFCLWTGLRAILNFDKMKHILLLTFIFLFVLSSPAQTIRLGVLDFYTYIYSNPKLVESENLPNWHRSFDFPNFEYSYEHHYKDFDFILSYMKFNTGTYISTDYIVFGDDDILIRRFDLGLGYDIFKGKQWFYIKPSLFLGLQSSKPTMRNNCLGCMKSVTGPNYFEDTTWVTSYNNVQLIPSFSLNVGVKIIKRIGVGLEYKLSYAGKMVQSIDFKYYYKDRPNDILYTKSRATGTGRYISYYISYDLAPREIKTQKQGRL